jgi:hypothetical protein
LQISWESRLNVQYTLQWSEACTGTNWMTLTNVAGNGATCFAFDRITELPRFYRALSTP